MTSKLFTPLQLGPLELQNRIIVSPMCQYSANNGVARDWHIMHIGQFAVANPGLIFLEGTAISPEGRITIGDLCLYTDEQEQGIKRIVEFTKAHSDTKIGVQLFHAGRKGSQNRPWDNNAEYGQGDTIAQKDGGWQTYGPSAIAYSEDYSRPNEINTDQLAKIKQDFVDSALRAHRAGLDTVELHYAHGYLLHTFLSAVSNQRTDDYGGTAENRMRFPLEVFAAVRDVWPESKPLGARISGSDFGTDETPWSIEDAVHFGKQLKEVGADYLDVSGGFLSPAQDIMAVYGPAFQAGLASQVRAAVDIPTISVGAITHAKQAEQIIQDGKADAVAIARGMLYDPRWPWHAAFELGEAPNYPQQYERAFALGYPDMFSMHLAG